ncbi:MAG: hypothetical protein EOP65_16645, partial [Sphingomonas sp.]
MRRSRVTAWIAPAGGALAGLATAALFLLVPQAVLEDWVWQSGLPALIAVAAPPLGDTARAVLALAGGGLAAAVTWSALFLLFGAGGLFAPRPATDAGVPVLRRADAHPDALPEVPREPVRPVLPLRPPALAAAEPTPVPSESPQPVAPPAPAGPSEVPSIESLLDRLER